MANPKPEQNDVAIAHKAINIASGLSGADKAVASAIIDHYNKKTGQCDPSIERLAILLDLDERTVRRATAALCDQHKLFQKKSHGGKSSRASYTPLWFAFRAVVAEWDRKMRGVFDHENGGGNRAEMSGSEAGIESDQPDISVHQTGHFSPVEPDKNVLQTYIINPSYEPIYPLTAVCDAAREPKTPSLGHASQGLLREEIVARQAPGYQARERAATKGCSRSEAAWMAAARRLDAAIASADTQWQSAVWVLTDEADRNHAITAELKHRGEGIACLQAAVRLARLSGEGSEYAH